MAEASSCRNLQHRWAARSARANLVSLPRACYAQSSTYSSAFPAVVGFSAAALLNNFSFSC